MYFVPLVAGKPALDDAVVLNEGGAGQFRHRRPIVRVWPEVIWFDDTGLNIFDLISREARQVEFEGQPERGHDEVRGFDGRFVALRKLVVDITTGKQVARFTDNNPVAMRDGVMYELEVQRVGNTSRPSGMVLRARDLLHNPNRAIDLLSVEPYDLYWSYGSRRQIAPNSGPTLVHASETGMHLYDGKDWVVVPYLERPAPDQPAVPVPAS